MSTQQAVLDRLIELERKDTAKSDEIRRLHEHRQRLEDKVLVLQNDNLELKKEVFMYRKESIHLKDKVEEIKYDITRLSEEKKAIPVIITELQRLSTEFKKYDVIGADVNRLSEDMKNIIPTIIAKIERLPSETEVLDLKKRTNLIEIREGNVSQSVTCVRLGNETDLIPYQYTKLTKCCGINISRGGLFDMTSGCLVPQCNGDFAVVVLFGQSGEGRIVIGLNYDDNVGQCGNEGRRHYVGQTVTDGDTFCGMMCLTLQKGQKVWFEALRCKGVANVSWCRLICWLIS